MQRGEIWFAALPQGDRPVLVLTRDPVADRIQSVVVAVLTRTNRGLISELQLTTATDGVPTDCVVSFDNLHTVPRRAFRRRVASLSPLRMNEACQALNNALGCWALESGAVGGRHGESR
jgi:mRNA interferase MazF